MTLLAAAEIPLVDLKAQYETVREEILAAIADVLDGMHLYLGPRQEAFEEAYARYCEAAACVSVSNGTDALELALRALGVGPGDEAITQPNSFIATAEAISATGATPVFVDADERTLTLDPTLLEAAITPNTKAIIPVHLYGRPADMEPILEIAQRHGVRVIEDASQAHGARYHGRRVGSLGDLACFSFYFSKNLGAYGEAGAITTNDPVLAEQLALYRSHGSRVRYRHEVIGRNSRMDEIQAAILGIKLRYLDQWNEQRRHNAARLSAALADTSLELPAPGGNDVYEVFHLYVVRHPEREALRQFLVERGINAAIHYPQPIHLQPAYAFLGHTPGDFPVSERLADTVLSLPIYAELTEEQIERIAGAVHAFDRAGSQ
ncbi:MAG TPA: DegT/DnrJ/EryC1/StrS family aminotransferase [Ktedonobacterales bacterium]|jgi:dTDP-4-amino-4,6-dideoxygalactose transaminase|nr:DegT/DnrJ/EryC1/StrS family aminotransferase [Ktedonobacterales bacterium]